MKCNKPIFKKYKPFKECVKQRENKILFNEYEFCPICGESKDIVEIPSYGICEDPYKENAYRCNNCGYEATSTEFTKFIKHPDEYVKTVSDLRTKYEMNKIQEYEFCPICGCNKIKTIPGGKYSDPYKGKKHTYECSYCGFQNEQIKFNFVFDTKNLAEDYRCELKKKYLKDKDDSRWDNITPSDNKSSDNNVNDILEKCLNAIEDIDELRRAIQEARDM